MDIFRDKVSRIIYREGVRIRMKLINAIRGINLRASCSIHIEKVRKRISSLLIALACLSMFSTGFADIDKTYSDNQPPVSEEAALEKVAAFVLQQFNVSHSEVLRQYDYSHIIGPGSQWGASTDAECWLITFENNEFIATNVFLQDFILLVNSTSGEIEYWEFRDKITNATYQLTTPDMSDFQVNEIYLIAENNLLQAKPELQKQPVPMCFEALLSNNTSALVWEVNVFFSFDNLNYVYQTRIDPQTGEVVFHTIEQIQDKT